MTKIVRNRLSVLAWTASIVCSVLLLISAIAAAEHKQRGYTADPGQPAGFIAVPQ